MLIQMANEVTGLTKAEIGILKRGKYEREEDKCIICYCDYEKGDDILTLKCKHYFHENCVSQWLIQNPHCPLCKAIQK